METIFITGANRGIGFELTKEYLAAGYRVIATCRLHQEDHLKILPQQNNLYVITLDVCDIEQIKHLKDQIKNEAIDILINNAGVIGNHGDTHEIDVDAWIHTFKVNTIGPMLIAQALKDNIARSTRKILANMSSTLGSISLNNQGGYDYYRASKAALNAITKNLSIAFKPNNITVVSLHPGWVKTDMGGENAPLTVEQSVAGLRQVLKNLSIKDTGSFISYDGERLMW